MKLPLSTHLTKSHPFLYMQLKFLSLHFKILLWLSFLPLHQAGGEIIFPSSETIAKQIRFKLSIVCMYRYLSLRHKPCRRQRSIKYDLLIYLFILQFCSGILFVCLFLLLFFFWWGKGDRLEGRQKNKIKERKKKQNKTWLFPPIATPGPRPEPWGWGWAHTQQENSNNLGWGGASGEHKVSFPDSMAEEAACLEAEGLGGEVWGVGWMGGEGREWRNFTE